MREIRSFKNHCNMSNFPKNTMIQGRMGREVIVEGLFSVKNIKEVLHLILCVHPHSGR